MNKQGHLTLMMFSGLLRVIFLMKGLEGCKREEKEGCHVLYYDQEQVLVKNILHLVAAVQRH
jgi:hypothetical protein